MKLSYSGMTTYNECGYKFFNHYFMKLRTVEEKSAFAFGHSIDEALNVLLTTRNLEDAKAVFLTEWDKFKTATNIAFSKADLEDHLIPDCTETNVKLRSWYSIQAKGLIMVEEYAEQVLPLIKTVLAVQVPISLPNAAGDELVGFIDFVAELHTGEVVIFDNKTTSVKYDLDSVSKSEQLSTYYEALASKYGATKAGYITIPKKINKKKKPSIKIDFIIDNISETLIEETFMKYDEVLSAVKAGVFPQNLNSCINKYGK
jgi:ATP-dependent helicase/DNAse subunit B